MGGVINIIQRESSSLWTKDEDSYELMMKIIKD